MSISSQSVWRWLFKSTRTFMKDSCLCPQYLNSSNQRKLAGQEERQLFKKESGMREEQTRTIFQCRVSLNKIRKLKVKPRKLTRTCQRTQATTMMTALKKLQIKKGEIERSIHWANIQQFKIRKKRRRILQSAKAQTNRINLTKRTRTMKTLSKILLLMMEQLLMTPRTFLSEMTKSRPSKLKKTTVSPKVLRFSRSLTKRSISHNQNRENIRWLDSMKSDWSPKCFTSRKKVLVSSLQVTTCWRNKSKGVIWGKSTSWQSKVMTSWATMTTPTSTWPSRRLLGELSKKKKCWVRP